MKKEKPIGLYTRSMVGHRGAYTNFAKILFQAKVCNRRTTLLSKEPVLFLMADDLFIHFFLTALLRSLTFKKTVGLLFRPEPALTMQSGTQKLKKLLLKTLKCLPRVQTLSIVPVPLKPEIGEIVDGWIHDFQLWDMTDDDRQLFDDLQAGRLPQDNPAAQFYQRIKAEAHGRPILVSLGMQSKGKGYEILSQAVPELSSSGWFVVAAGKVSDDQKINMPAFIEHGMMSENRFLSDDEIIATYAAADVVWCLYDPSYDQASGILGRAIQFGVPPLVRSGSFSQAFCKSVDVSHLATSDAKQVASTLAAGGAEASREAGLQLSRKLREENIARLSEALWGKGKTEHE